MTRSACVVADPESIRNASEEFPGRSDEHRVEWPIPNFFASGRVVVGPLQILMRFALLGLALVLLSVWSATRVPWLGFTVEQQPGGAGVRVKTVAPEGPAQALLRPGAVLLALSNGSGRTAVANALWTLDYPYQLATYADLDRLVAEQHELFALLLAQPKLFAALGDGTRLALAAAPRRPITDLSPDFWLVSLIGYGGFLIGIAVWSCRRQDISARLFAAGGGGFLLLALGAAAFSSRELAVAPAILPYLMAGERTGDLILAYSLCALLWYCPAPLARAPVARLMVTLIVLLGLNDAFQILQFPLHAFMVPDFLIPFSVSVVLGVLQWRKSRNDPIARGSLRWLLLSFFVGTTAVLLLEYAPPAFGVPRITPLWLGFAAVFTLYLGIAFGILRYRLFDLERWWLNIWWWLAGGLGVLAIDVLLVSVLELNAGGALGLAALLVGWVYFPLRQRLWGRLSGGHPRPVEAYLPQLNDFLSWPDHHQDLDREWRRLLRRVFEPLGINPDPQAPATPELDRNGLELTVPAVSTAPGLRLTGCSHGHRLFTRDDVHLAAALLALARQGQRQRQAHADGLRRERARILRDLHDDVAAPLLMLTHRAETEGDRACARSALQALRDAVHGLQRPESMPLSEVLADWRVEVRERLAATGVALCWDNDPPAADAELTARERINLGRVLREAVSNALTHARPRTVTITSEMQGRRLRLCIANDGADGDPEHWLIQHTGLSNMQNRVAEMNGEISWRCGNAAARDTIVEVLIPLRMLDGETGARNNG